MTSNDSSGHVLAQRGVRVQGPHEHGPESPATIPSGADGHLLSELRDQLLSRLSGLIHRIVLFGSRARGDAGEDADMDVLIVLEDGRPPVLDQVRAVRYDVMQHHGFRPLISLLLLTERDWQELPRRSAGLKHNIEREGITIWPTK